MNKNLHQDETEEYLKEAETTDNLCVGEHIDLIEGMFLTLETFPKKRKEWVRYALLLNMEILSFNKKTGPIDKKGSFVYDTIKLEKDVKENSAKKDSVEKTIEQKQGKKEGRKGENNKVAQVVYGDVEKVKPEGV